MALSGWNQDNKLKLIIDSTKIDGDLSDFPVCIDISASAGISEFDTTAIFDELTIVAGDFYTKLLLHMDDPDLIDSSDNMHTTTLSGNVVVSSTQSKFGGYSAYFPGDVGDYISVPDHDDWNLGSGNFTIDFWLMFGATATIQIIWEQAYADPDQLFYWNGPGGNLVFTSTNTGTMANYSWLWTPDTSTWYHIALVRNGTSLVCYVDGIILTSNITTPISTNALPDASAVLSIGARSTGAYPIITGYIDEFRWSKGIARWTSNFTPPESSHGRSWDNRKKIAITDSNDNQLYTEIESWNHNNEQAVLWTKIPTVSSVSGTVLYLYYDSSQSDNTTYIGDTGDSAAKNVWDDNFIGVWHLGESGAGAVGEFKDSTSNIHNGQGITTPTQIDGLIGKAQDFELSSSQYISIPDSNIFDIGTGDFTISCVIKPESIPGSMRMLSRGSVFPRIEGSWTCGVGTTWGGGTKINFATCTSTTTYDGLSDAITLTPDTWYKLDVVRSSGVVYFYLDTTGVGSTALAQTLDCNQVELIGCRLTTATPSEFFDGVIDELCMSNVVRNAAWIKATYYSNLDDLVNFEFAGWDVNNRLTITIDGSKIEEDLTDFPVNITLSSGTGINTYDATAVFDELTASGTDDYTKLLLHMDDVGLTDSSSSQHTITLNDGAARSITQSKFNGYSAYFDGAGDYLSLADSADWDFGTGDFTIDFWMRRVATYGGGKDVVSCNQTSTPGWLVHIASSLLYFYHDGSNIFSVSYTEVLNSWEHYTLVRSGDNMYYFVNGSQKGATGTGHSARTINGSNFLKIAGRGADAADPNCYIDEFRISKGIARWTSNFTPPGGPYGSSWWNRSKIAITDSGDNQLYTEIERWDCVAEEANLWVRVPTIVSGTDTILYLYYDSNQSDNTTYVGDTGNSAAQNVWDDNFVGVWHVAQDPSGGVGAILDSTVSDFDATAGGTMLTEDLVDGKTGKAIEFDGSDDYLTPGDISMDFGSGGLTLEAIIKAPNSGTDRVIVHRQDDLNSYNPHIKFKLNTTGNIGFLVRGKTNPLSKIDITSDSEDYDDNAFHHVAGIFDDAAGSGLIMVDGSADGTNSSKTTTDVDFGQANLQIGRLFQGWIPNDDEYFSGTIDEVRISNIARSPAWVKATYYGNWNGLVTFSSEGAPTTIDFYFSNPIPTDLSTVYGISHQLYLTTTVTGSASNYIYDATFYNAYNDSLIDTASGIQSGYPANVLFSTPSGINYQWYVTATSSGSEDTSDTYTFINRFLCSGQTQISDIPASGIPVRLYLRDTGEYIGGTTSAGVSGTFQIETTHNDYHYAVALYDLINTNALIADWLTPNN